MGKIAKSKARKELNDKKLGFEPSDRLSGQKRKRNQKVRKSYTHEEVYIYICLTYFCITLSLHPIIFKIVIIN